MATRIDDWSKLIGSGIGKQGIAIAIYRKASFMSKLSISLRSNASLWLSDLSPSLVSDSAIKESSILPRRNRLQQGFQGTLIVPIHGPSHGMSSSSSSSM